MYMALPLFSLFSIYAIVNSYLPVFLREMGYSVTIVGILIGIFELAGATLPFFICNIPAKKGNYISFLLYFALIMTLLPFPLLNIPLIPITIVVLAIYAAAFKGAVPVSDSFLNVQFAGKSYMYGRIRAMGSVGFVITNIILQFTLDLDNISLPQAAVWMSALALFYMLSLLIAQRFVNTTYVTAEACKKNGVVKSSKNDRELASDSKVSLFKSFSFEYWLVMIMLFFTIFGQAPSMRFLSLYVKEELGSNAAGMLWALSALSEIPMMIFSSRFIKRFGTVKLLIFASLVTTVRTLVYVLVPSLGGAAFAQAMHSITFGLFHPAAVVFVATRVKNKEHTVLAQAIYSVGTLGLATMAGSAVGGIIVDVSGYTALFSIFSVFPLIGVAIYGLFRKKITERGIA